MSDQVISRLKVPVVRSKPYLRLVSYFGCVVPGCQWWCSPIMTARILDEIRTHGHGYVVPHPYVVAHHHRDSAHAGTGMKPGDNRTCGLCQEPHHLEVHRIGAKAFASKYGVDWEAECAKMAAVGRMLGFLPEIAA